MVRILFAGSPEAALPSLKAVAEFTDDLTVMSQPDRPVGRKRILTPTPVSLWALEHDIPLFRPETGDDLRADVARIAPDLGVTVAFGRLLSPDVLSLPRYGWWNVHFSLLPRYRGAAPVQHALFEGDSSTGVSVFQIEEGLDTGPILAARPHPIEPGITAGVLLDELSHVGAEVLGQLLEALARQHPDEGLPTTAQTGEATSAPKPARETGHILATDSLDMAFRRFQATTPEPGCFVSFDAGRHALRLLQVSAQPGPTVDPPGMISATGGDITLALGGGYLLLHEVHPSGKKPMTAEQWWRGVQRGVSIDD